MAWMGWLRSLAGWVLGVLGVLASAALVAALAYWGLLGLGLQPRGAAAVAFPLGPAFVVALFTVALWRSTQVQARATQEMKELQARLARLDLAPMFVLRVRASVSRRSGSSNSFGVSLQGIFNLGRVCFVVERVSWKYGERVFFKDLNEPVCPAKPFEPSTAIFVGARDAEAGELKAKAEAVQRLASGARKGVASEVTLPEPLEFGDLVVRVAFPGGGVKEFCYRLHVPSGEKAGVLPSERELDWSLHASLNLEPC